MYSRCVSLSVAQIETLSDGLLHEAIDTEPLASFQARLDQLQPGVVPIENMHAPWQQAGVRLKRT